MKGKVKWFNPRKGFGFIIGEDGKIMHIIDKVDTEKHSAQIIALVKPELNK